MAETVGTKRLHKQYTEIPHVQGNVTFVEDLTKDLSIDFVIKQSEDLENRVRNYYKWLREMETKYAETGSLEHIANYEKAGAYRTASDMLKMMFEDRVDNLDRSKLDNSAEKK